jgi:hypothetical protein
MEDGNTAALRIEMQRQDDAPDLWMQPALESVVETVMLFGQYPQPSPNIHRQRQVQFLLCDWIGENIDVSTMAMSMSCSLDYGTEFDTLRFKIEENIRLALVEHFKDSEIVQEKAEEMRRDSKDDQ